MLMTEARYSLKALAFDNLNYWYVLLVSFVVQELLDVLINYKKFPEQQQDDLWIVFTHPVHRLIINFFGKLAFLRAVFIEIPGAQS